MCGIVGIVGQAPVNQEIYDALLLLQHRGQDATGIATCRAPSASCTRRAAWCARSSARATCARCSAASASATCATPTKGTASSEEEAQPFYVNAPYGIVLVHNGNLTNTRDAETELFHIDRRHLNTDSDTELLVNVLANELQFAARDLH